MRETSTGYGSNPRGISPSTSLEHSRHSRAAEMMLFFLLPHSAKIVTLPHGVSLFNVFFMFNRISLSLFVIFLLIAYTAAAADDKLTEVVKKDLREHIEFTETNGDEAAKERLDTLGITRLTDWRTAAEAGIPEGQVLLGICYHYGMLAKQYKFGIFRLNINLSQDYAESVSWYRKAAEQGNAEGQYALAQCYYSGLGVPEDEEEAVKWFREAAEQGYADAQYMLAQCYAHGKGISENGREAVRWVRKAAEQGHHGARQIVASFVGRLREIREQGDADGLLILGECYRQGIGVAEDKAEAIKLFHQSAELGNADAMLMLGICYRIGDGVDKNKTEAVKWLRQSAKLGNADAKHALNMHYMSDVVEVVKWFRGTPSQDSIETTDLSIETEEEQSAPKNAGTRLFDQLSSPSSSASLLK